MSEHGQAPRRMRVLFVDDEEIVLSCIKRMLCITCKEWDLEFESDSNVAAKRLLTEPYDAVVADANMPGMSGCELLEQVAKSQPRSARIVLSGGLDRKASEMVAVHRFRVIEKPCDCETLKHTITEAVDDNYTGQAA